MTTFRQKVILCAENTEIPSTFEQNKSKYDNVTIFIINKEYKGTSKNIETIWYYDNSFRIGKYKVYEQDVYVNRTIDNTCFNVHTFIDDFTIKIPYFGTSLYYKIVYILALIGIRSVGLHGYGNLNTSLFFNKTVPKQSVKIRDIIDVYDSSSFSTFITQFGINFYLINDDKSMIKGIMRCLLDDFLEPFVKSIEWSSERCFWEYLFSDNNSNKLFVQSYTDVYNKISCTDPDNVKLVNQLYFQVNYDLIDDSLMEQYAQIEFLKFDIELNQTKVQLFSKYFKGLPLNKNDYNKLYQYYKFNPSVYQEILKYEQSSNFSSCNDFSLFIFFLLFESDKIIFDVPDAFSCNRYIELNKDLKQAKMCPRDALKHFINQGSNQEQREIYMMPDRFDWKMYCKLNNLQIATKYEAEYHYLTIGETHNFLTTSSLPKNFDIGSYRSSNPIIKNASDVQVIKHFIMNNRADFAFSNLPRKFNPKQYISLNPDLANRFGNSSIQEITDHFTTHGIYENRCIHKTKLSFTKKVCAICHIGSIDVFKTMENSVQHLIDFKSPKYSTDVYLCISKNKLNTIDKIQYITSKYSVHKNVYIHMFDNFGFDIGSFFKILDIHRQTSMNYDYIVKIHTKTSDEERDKLMKPLIGSVNRIEYILDVFDSCSDIGLIGSDKCAFWNYDKLAIHNQNHLMKLLKKFNIPMQCSASVQFVGGTMFWMRYSILERTFRCTDYNDIISMLNDVNSFDWNWYICANEPFIENVKDLNNAEKALEHYNTVGKKVGLSGNMFHAIEFGTKTPPIRDAMIEHAFERLFSYMTEGMNYEQYFIPYDSFTKVHRIEPLPIVFPQFHQIPENDKFWGTGFTEWTMLNKLSHDYLGQKMQKPHYSIGQYNILTQEYRRFIENITEKYNINYMCYYHYWFSGDKDKVMYKPAELLRDSNSRLKYCFSWANETWSSRWDGLSTNILIQQKYGEIGDWERHITYLLTFFKDEKYIKINNKPLMFVYRPLDIPKETFAKMFEYFNKVLIKNGFNGLELIITFNNTSNNKYCTKEREYITVPSTMGIMDFNPNYMNSQAFSSYQVLDNAVIFDIDENGNYEYNEQAYLAYNLDIRIAVQQGVLKSGKEHYDSVSKEELKTRIQRSSLGDIVKTYELIELEPRKHPNQFYSVFMDWNNSPRRDITKIEQGIKPTIFLNASPQLFFLHVKKMIKKIIKDPNPNVNFLIINAWNEWNEQTTLEPSDIYEYKYIESLSNAFNEYY